MESRRLRLRDATIKGDRAHLSVVLLKRRRRKYRGSERVDLSGKFPGAARGTSNYAGDGAAAGYRRKRNLFLPSSSKTRLCFQPREHHPANPLRPLLNPFLLPQEYALYARRKFHSAPRCMDRGLAMTHRAIMRPRNFARIFG